MKLCIFTRFLSVHVKAQKKVWKGAPDWQKWLLRELGVWWGETCFVCEVHTSFFNNYLIIKLSGPGLSFGLRDLFIF